MKRLSPPKGEIETRRCHILPAGEYLMGENIERRKGIATIVRIVSTGKSKGHVIQDIRYYISDEKKRMPPISMRWQEVIGALKISRIGCWTLISGKIVAGQDKKRVCTPNLSVLGKMALQIVSNQKDKLSIKKRTYKAALDIGYLKN